jgi:hypothetical protein
VGNVDCSESHIGGTSISSTGVPDIDRALSPMLTPSVAQGFDVERIALYPFPL